MTPCKGCFSIYKLVDNRIVYIGNNQAYKITGIGTVTIKISDNIERTIHGVRHVPSLKRNLISLGQLKDGYVFKGQCAELKIT